MTEKKPKIPLEGFIRVTKDLDREIEGEAYRRDLFKYQVVEAAWRVYKQQPSSVEGQATLPAPANVAAEIEKESAERGLSVPEMIQIAWDLVSEHEQRGDRGPLAFPSPFAGLSDDDIFVLHNYIEILREQPQGAIYRTLHRVTREAVTEWRNKLTPKTGVLTSSWTSEVTSHPPASSVTDLEEIAIGRLLRILRSPKPGLPDAILSNLAQFEDTADLYERSRLDPAAGPAASPQERARERDSGIAALARDTRAIAGGITEARRSMEAVGKAREQPVRGQKKSSGKARKRS